MGQVRRLVEGGFDYVGIEGWPLGIAAEACRVTALATADREATDAAEREHVMPFLYARPERFRIGRLAGAGSAPPARGRATPSTPRRTSPSLEPSRHGSATVRRSRSTSWRRSSTTSPSCSTSTPAVRQTTVAGGAADGGWPMDVVRIGDRPVGAGAPVYVIAEAGSNHDRDLDQARRLIDVAAEAGADAVKFQTFRSDLIVAETPTRAEYLDAILPPGQTMSDLFRQLELPREWHADARRACGPSAASTSCRRRSTTRRSTCSTSSASRRSRSRRTSCGTCR